MSKKKGLGKFFAGALLGAGLGLLFAPTKGSETREALKKKIDELLNQLKDMDSEEIKNDFNKRIQDIKIELVDLDKEKVAAFAKEKGNQLKEKAQDLVELAKEKGTPAIRKSAEAVLESVISVSNDVLKKLENSNAKK